MQHRQMVFNLVGYALFVFANNIVVTGHCCPLKSTWMEASITILTVLIVPLAIFLAKSIKGAIGMMAFCFIIVVAADAIYSSLLHSRVFPREWLDKEAQEFVDLTDRQRVESYKKTLTPAP